MSATEVRAGQQRRYNRFYTQGDKCRAPPEFSGTPTASSSKSEHDHANVENCDEDPKDTTKKKDTEEFWFLKDDHFMDFNAFNSLNPDKREKLSSDLLDSHWMGAEKTEPWWRSAGKDELASFVAQKSLEIIENCDLPPPQMKHHRKRTSAFMECFGHDNVLASSVYQMAEIGIGLSITDSLTKGIPSLMSMDEKEYVSSNIGHSPHFEDQNFRADKVEEVDSISDNGPSKMQLLEALCHSQTRAREAEKAAEQAYKEKEHIVTLLFRQASQLLAYKQWLKLLQLQNICFQRKNKNDPITNLIPLPWIHKNQYRARKRKRGKTRRDTIAFALGLGLVGAGVLLGWTMGWLYPPA